MQSLTYAFRFISASFKLAFNQRRVQQAFLYLGLGGLALLVTWFLPLALVIGLIGLKPIGLVLIGLISIFALVSVNLWGEITSLLVITAFSEQITLTEEDTPEEKPTQVIRTHWQDVILSRFIVPGSQFINFFNQVFSSDEPQNHSWLDHAYLLMPLIALEQRHFDGAVTRVRQMVEENLFRVQRDFMDVNLVVRVVQWLLLGIGIVLGFVIGLKIADPLEAGVWIKILGAGVGFFVAGIFSLLGIMFSAFFRASYHTALYAWGMNVEAIRQLGKTGKASPPVVISQAMGLKVSQEEEA